MSSYFSDSFCRFMLTGSERAIFNLYSALFVQLLCDSFVLSFFVNVFGP